MKLLPYPTASLLVAACLAAVAVPAAGAADNAAPAPAARRTLQAFASEDELRALLQKLGDEQRKRMEERQKRAAKMDFAVGAPGGAVANMAAPAPAAPAAAKAEVAEGASVTNTQTAGVDEGGIVKVHGRHLVVLRRGRLFTVDVGAAEPKPVAVIDAFGPDVEPQGAWYDEMLIAGDTIVVIGYSYARGGTEIGLFNIDAAGQLSYRATYHLRSSDYYSSRNYASRLIGNKLIFYTPLHLSLGYGDPYARFPALRKWSKDAKPDDFRPIAPATRIYQTADPLDPAAGVTLHSVTTCDLAKAEMRCEATGVLGPSGRVFYVSGDAVYVWTTQHRYGGGTSRSSVFRLPLNGDAPTALKTAGSPIDQFSFLESDGQLNVLLRADGGGEGMWSAEARGGDLALLRVPVNSFSDGSESAPSRAYRSLPRPANQALQNRYVGPFLLYGSGPSWGRRQPSLLPNGDERVVAVRYAGDTPAQVIGLGHSVQRIEALGSHAVVVGVKDRDLYFTSLRLGGEAEAAHRYVRENAAQGETRSHGFFYKPEGDAAGLLGLPIRGGGQPGFKQLRSNSAAVLFLKNTALKLSELGQLDAEETGKLADGCRASCVDWYGNARPLFLKGRVFALMGYELVEGRLEDGRIREVGRVNFGQRVLEVSR